MISSDETGSEARVAPDDEGWAVWGEDEEDGGGVAPACTEETGKKKKRAPKTREKNAFSRSQSLPQPEEQACSHESKRRKSLRSGLTSQSVQRKQPHLSKSSPV